MNWFAQTVVLAALCHATTCGAAELNFYCDIDQGFTCTPPDNCKPVSQTDYPARYRFQINSVSGGGRFWSCPGNRCGTPYEGVAIQMTDRLQFVVRLTGETFIITRELSSFTYIWPNPVWSRGDGRGFGRCSILNR